MDVSKLNDDDVELCDASSPTSDGGFGFKRSSIGFASSSENILNDSCDHGEVLKLP